MLAGKRLYPYVERAVGESTGLLRFFKDDRRRPRIPSGILAGETELRAAVWAWLHRKVTKAAVCDVKGAIGGKAGIPGGKRAV
jgi:hypothetical protein